MLAEFEDIKDIRILPTIISISDEHRLLDFLNTALSTVDYCLFIYAKRTNTTQINRYLYIAVDYTDEFKELEMISTLKSGHGIATLSEIACNPFRETS